MEKKLENWKRMKRNLLRLSPKKITGLVSLLITTGIFYCITKFNTAEILVVKCQKENHIKEIDAISHTIFDTIEKDYRVIYTVLILISSHVTHKNRRIAIRKTWGNSSMWTTRDKYKIVFLTGKVKDANSMIEIAEEAKVSRDIISLDIPEDFYLLAKKVIVGLVWAKHNMKFKAILKGDDDTFMNLDNIIAFINQNTIIDGYFGNKMGNQRVDRIGRYKLTEEEHQRDRYDPYCSGGGFILTNSSVYKIIPNLDLDNILKIDDAHIGEVAFRAGTESISSFLDT